MYLSVIYKKKWFFCKKIILIVLSRHFSKKLKYGINYFCWQDCFMFCLPTNLIWNFHNFISLIQVYFHIRNCTHLTYIIQLIVIEIYIAKPLFKSGYIFAPLGKDSVSPFRVHPSLCTLPQGIRWFWLP